MAVLAADRPGEEGSCLTFSFSSSCLSSGLSAALRGEQAIVYTGEGQFSVFLSVPGDGRVSMGTRQGDIRTVRDEDEILKEG